MKNQLLTFTLLLSSAASFASDKAQHLSAGDTTVKRTHASAYSAHSANLKDVKGILKFNGGNKFFEEPWAQSVGSVSSQDGLGPLFNNNACQDCHVRDGRGHASEALDNQQGTDFSTMLLRAAKSDISESQKNAMSLGLQANVGDTCIGGQLQHEANFGIKQEASQAVSYRYQEISFTDGEKVTLRDPIWHVKGINCEIDDDTVLSARVAPPMIGLGLLALIDEKQILAQEDINDSNNDAISGKANKVWSVKAQQVTLGRFGWKAGQPTLRQQTAGAFLGDMGLTTDFFQQENCLEHQSDCKQSPNGNGDMADADYKFEVSTKVLNKITFYTNHLAVPARRNAYSTLVRNGQKLFNELGCQQCHTASYTTVKSAEFPELSNQKIYPYTDMLLHDMGEALTDFDKNSKTVKGDIPVEFLAQANEWRTPPLWGIGLAQTVDPNATFLHDGRARNLLEAVLWHGGEAEQSKQKVLQLSKKQRVELLAFLEDL
ncbi:di-heme oxidoreductase family protein [Psychromonas sp. Urea-02u-13]|uniref:di-heme oxidoreductase family protein n=1 Tax=Psychromonas sp. Urea-02u-13 TaxID=2058326 RepID=UPI000C34707A|nr:di-heme oxidoredictase family protein [Psychromonas sp. Urea-02u-13]PKG40394.1 thiol oxidoreductase [Psychromonas sp. Urea-02u-13]